MKSSQRLGHQLRVKRWWEREASPLQGSEMFYSLPRQTVSLLACSPGCSSREVPYHGNRDSSHGVGLWLGLWYFDSNSSSGTYPTEFLLSWFTNQLQTKSLETFWRGLLRQTFWFLSLITLDQQAFTDWFFIYGSLRPPLHFLLYCI